MVVVYNSPLPESSDTNGVDARDQRQARHSLVRVEVLSDPLCV